MTPRIDTGDYITSDDFVVFVGEYARCPLWDEGHIIADAVGNTPCGRTFDIGWEAWESVRRFRRQTPIGLTPKGKTRIRYDGEWYVALDRRKGNKCAECGRRWALHQTLEEFRSKVRATSRNLESDAPLPRRTRSDEAMRVRDLQFVQRVQLVKTMLGAVEVEDEYTEAA